MGATGGIGHEAIGGVRTIVGRASPYVGRERELAELEASFRASVEHRAARATLVVGEAGVGKTRLASEHVARLSEPATVLVATGDPVASPLSVIRALLRLAAAAPVGAGPERARDRLHAHAARIGLDPSATQLLAELLGITSRDPLPRVVAARNDPRVKRGAVRSAIVAWLGAAVASGPLVIVLDDAHACDGASLGCLGAALDACRARPLHVVALSRPGSVDVLPPSWPRDLVRELPLAPLSRGSAEQLARAVLGPASADVARVVERAAGNAFHLEELLRHVALRLEAPLPDAPDAVARARVRQLPSAAHDVLLAASVLGGRPTASAVRHVVGADVASTVETLVAAELLQPSRGLAARDREIRFRHGLLRDAAYARSSDEERARVHRRAAEWLARVAEREPLSVAEHHERAGDPRAAVPFRVLAAEDAIAGGDFRVAREQADLGLRAASDPELRARLLSVKAAIAEAEGRWNELRTHVREAMQLVEPGSARWFVGASTLGYAGMVLHDPSTIVELIQAIQPLRTELPASGPTGFAFQNIIAAGFHAGQRELMKTFVARLDATAAAAGAVDRDPVFDAWRALSHAYDAVVDDDLARALVEAERAASCASEADDYQAMRTTRGMLGYFRAEAGDLDGAEAAIEDVRPRGDDVASLLASYVRARAALERGDLERVVALSSDVPRAIVPAARARIVLADALVRAGDVHEGERIAAQIAESSETLPSLLATVLPVLSRATLARGDAAEALRVAVRGYAISGRTGYVRDRSDAILARVEALEALGRVDEARAAREAAVARVERIALGLPARLRAGFVALPVHARTLSSRVR